MGLRSSTGKRHLQTLKGDQAHERGDGGRHRQREETGSGKQANRGGHPEPGGGRNANYLLSSGDDDAGANESNALDDGRGDPSWIGDAADSVKLLAQE